ncbi:MAG: RAMP superfamily CRISPR-associated protein, partial [Streptosporangiaceae bacterium]
MTGSLRRFPVRVCMLSDWIVGTGEGRAGDVDATVRRDGDGLPFIPAKSLTGIWRDACEQVAAWLGAPGQEANPWRGWVDWIFGSQPDVTTDAARIAHRGPQPAALALSPARLPRLLRDACRGRSALLAAAVLVRPGVAIDDYTGVASDDMLRVEERARPETLEAWAEFTAFDDDAVPLPAEFLLRAGATAIDGLGGKRNRGAGACWLLLPGTDLPSSEALIPATPRPADQRLAELAADTAMLDNPGPAPQHQPSGPRLAVPAATADHPGTLRQSGSGPGPRTTWRVTFEV